MRLLSVSLLSCLLVCVAVPACSSDSDSGPDCAAKSKCANQPASDVNACNKAANDSRCGGLYKTMLSCFQKNETCNASGATDLNALDSICAAQREDWTRCTTRPLDGGS